MRDDLNKLLCERERHGHRNRFKPFRRTKAFSPAADEDGDNRSQREGISRRYGYSRKSFNENLNPLKGQVRKAVGRPYRKFYSELCKIFDKRSVINQHILQHLKDYLSTGGVRWQRRPALGSRESLAGRATARSLAGRVLRRSA